MDPLSLPVYQQKDRILKALDHNQVVVVESPTGSGKTTQIPIILHEAGFTGEGIIGITQPRRIAAVSVSEFIAKQLNTNVPGLVGYKMRFIDHTDVTTRIKIMTDGILLQELKANPDLSKYSLIMIDEAHERSLNIDFILGLLKQIMERRKDLKVIISSATINADVFSEYFDECPIVHIDARMYPVDIIYDPPDSRYYQDELVFHIFSIIKKLVKRKDQGDILVFLSGEKPIKECASLLTSSPFAKKLHVLPLYGRLGKEAQDKAFLPTPKGKIKVVIATNIAETSITIDGITSVIDSGLGKINYYNPRTYTSSLIESPVSKASCNQRKGRAGRTRPGVCFRLYGKHEFEGRSLFTTEEIFRTDLSEVVLRMAELGIQDFEDFDFISSPGIQGIHSAIETLKLFGALEDDRSLSKIGQLMVRFPLLPRHGRMIVEAIMSYPEVLEEVLIATAFISTNSPYLLPSGEELAARRAHHCFRDDLGDFVSYLKLFRAYQKTRDRDDFCNTYYLDRKAMDEILNIKNQLEEIVSGMGIPILSGGPVADYLCAISAGLIQFVCARSGRDVYQSLTAEKIHIHPGSVMFRQTPRFIVAGEIVKTSRMFARSVSPLQKSWLSQISKELAEELITDEAHKVVKKRDTTWEIRIGSTAFSLKPYKGKKKIAILHWEKLKPLLHSLSEEQFARFRGLRGKIIYGGWDLLSGEKLSAILKIGKKIDINTDLKRKPLSRKNYRINENPSDLCGQLFRILSVCRMKKNSLGFVSLNTNGQGTYWFKCSRSYHSALSESLYSLETIADEIASELQDEDLSLFNSTYRRLSSDLAEL